MVHGDMVVTMDSDVRDLWVMALRSGTYPQGQFRLRSDEDTYCPLGVLADLAVRLNVVTWEKLDGKWFLAPWVEGTFLPHKVQEWAGFTGMHSS